MILLVQLFIAHLAGDFFLQPDAWTIDKKVRKLRSPYLYLHTLIHFALILAVVGRMDFWMPALVLALAHFAVDSIKLLAQTAKTERSWFFIDQLLHLISLFAVWAWVQHPVLQFQAWSDKSVLIPAATVLFVLNPSSYAIKNIVSKWAPAAHPQTSPSPAGKDSLSKAGSLIGMLERLMIVVFIFLGKWEGVGFLLAAKSVFRFGDLKDARDRQLTEYVLIGTLLSFAMAILAAQLALYLLSH